MLFFQLERTAYEVVVEDGKFIYKQSREVLHTTGVDKHVKWIFVLSTSRYLYVGKKQKGTFQHSSFLAGGATSAAGRLVVENGILKVQVTELVECSFFLSMEFLLCKWLAFNLENIHLIMISSR